MISCDIISIIYQFDSTYKKAFDMVIYELEFYYILNLISYN